MSKKQWRVESLPLADGQDLEDLLNGLEHEGYEIYKIIGFNNVEDGLGHASVTVIAYKYVIVR